MTDADRPTSTTCPGCGAVLAGGPDPGQPRPGASPACARLLEDTLRGLRDDAAADGGAAAVLRRAEDAYAAQHPDPADPGRVSAARARLGSAAAGDPPEVWRTTIADVAADLDVVELHVLVETWARSVVDDWAVAAVR